MLLSGGPKGEKGARGVLAREMTEDACDQFDGGGGLRRLDGGGCL
jgi:hypothetical protein